MKKFFNAFTLSEVLITLGVIGVVAAITLPTLIHNYQKKTWVEGLKVAYSTLSQGMQKAMADSEVTNFADTDLFKNCNWNNYKGKTEKKWACFKEMNKYLKTAEMLSWYESKDLGATEYEIDDTETCKKIVGTAGYGYYLNDNKKCAGNHDLGFLFANSMTGDILFYDYTWYLGNVTIDVNGKKGPNTWGRDIFYFLISTDGTLLPCTSEKNMKLKAEYYNIPFETQMQSHWKNKDRCSKTTTEYGYACSARVIESGWKMDY